MNSSRIVNQSINNSVQVNVLNLIEQKISSSPKIYQKIYQKRFEPTLFELEHSDNNDITRGLIRLISSFD